MKALYQQTAVGLIPADWEFEPLGIHVISSAYGPRFSNEHYDGRGNMALLRTTDLDDSGNLFLQQMPRVELPIEQFKNHVLCPGDFLISRSGTCGISTVFPGFEIPVLPGAFLIRFRFTAKVDSQFLKLFLNSEYGKRYLQRLTEGGVQKNIRASALVRLPLPLPPPAEQRAIARALSDVDALLGALDRLIAKRGDLKQAAMQQILTGRTRLPGFHGEWKETTLGEIGECIIGLTYKPANVVEYGMLVLRSSNVQNSQLAYEDNVYVNVEVPENLVTRPGDILICVRNGSRALIGKSAIIDDVAAGVTFGAFMSVYRSEHSRFIFHAFRAHDIQRQIYENIGATINQITNKDMNAFLVKLPPVPEQIAIAEVLFDMDAELAALEQRRAKTQALKQGMMQELLTGKIRLVSKA